MQRTKLCLQCGKTITKPQNESLKNWLSRHKYCSKRCLGLAHTSKVGKNTRFKLGQKAINPIKKGQSLSPNTQFKKGSIPWNKGKVMSSKLKKKLMKTSFFKKEFGEKSPNWRGGTTKLGQLIRSNKKYLEWRLKIFKRDKYTCVLCGRIRRPGDRVIIEADHYPKPFYLIIRENKIKTIQDALDCKELWLLSNARTLCKECHQDTDTHLLNQHSSRLKSDYKKL